ncbi:uncharacterized protein BO66DRAFT_355744 [Aspergillus aculeatinus CBS 121060]|uniref:Uncharacterized protein n=1 Tax=Aspergillus aculeatinus CBS 121060 TaxID=1448322 RepID=A0ACD1H0N7_9EURO|nr:hypothetical protein BO66DRAFT_355744 [Aspergillus aculeatinus CBS 121060]RAH67118.1 hypothetical protein BO66DRAFT_355744 [Aspergillus aculeatinus CBS 121060]
MSDAHREGLPLAKRRRVALACSACRTRKSRCDGRRPSCSTCTALTLECLYDPPDSAANVLVRKEYVSELEQRLKHVESLLRRHDDLLTGHLASCSTSAPQFLTGRAGDRASVSSVDHAQGGIHLNALDVDDAESDETKTDGLAIKFVEEPTPVYYGRSSSIAFTRCLLRAMSVAPRTKQTETPISCREAGSVDCRPADPAQQYSPSVLDSPKSECVSATALPSEDEMDTLLTAYFNAWGSLFPFLHEPTFRQIYEDCKANGFRKARRTWLGLLNMMFAMTTNIDQRAEVSAKQRFRKSYVFFQRAVALCSEIATRAISLDIVHYFLLAALYLQGTQRSIQIWTVHGMLVRAAMALGLHSEQAAQGLHPIQEEIRRRTWLTIYCLDKLQSITSGRPPSIPDEYIVVKMPSPWKTTPHPIQGQLGDVDIETGFLSATVRLYRIMGRSVATQYGLNLGVPDQEMDESTAIQAASAMRQELRQWISNLPPALAIVAPCEAASTGSHEMTYSNRLRVILTLRYHFANILIHRPLLCATLGYLTVQGASVAGNLPYRLRLAVAEAHECIQSAEKTIEIVHAILTTKDPRSIGLDVWFFTLFYVLNSALVILGRSVLSQHGVYTNDSSNSAEARLAQALEALDRLDKDNRQVYNCAKFIRQLLEPQNGQASGQDPKSQADKGGLPYEHTLPTLGVPLLSDPDMAQFSSPHLLDYSVEEFNLNLEHLNYSY